MEKTPSWGIEPVPERLRLLGTLDSFLPWTNLGISLLLLLAASYFGLALKQAVLALLGPTGFVRRFVRKIGIWAVAASIVYLAVWILRNGHVGTLWRSGGSGGSFWLGVDLVIALTVSWVPLVADYTRFARSRRAAFVGAGVGYLLPALFQFGFGAILVLSHPSIGGPTDVLTTVAAGGVGSVLALLALTVDQTDQAL